LHIRESALLVKGSAGSAVFVGIILAWSRRPRTVASPTKGGAKDAFAAVKMLRIAQWPEYNILGHNTGLQKGNPMLLLLADQ
jgi:hypothetical protein